MNFDEQVKTILDWYHDSPARVQNEFKTTPKDALIAYHSTLGRDIRNELNLWEKRWEVMIKDGIDTSPNHPDAISMEIIERIWDIVNEKCEDE